jgi:hypothetical protein
MTAIKNYVFKKERLFQLRIPSANNLSAALSFCGYI